MFFVLLHLQTNTVEFIRRFIITNKSLNTVIMLFFKENVIAVYYFVQIHCS